MRDKNRIPRITKKIETLWEKHPDMRFGQLVVCLLGTDPFYLEDDLIEAKIDEWLKKK